MASSSSTKKIVLKSLDGEEFEEDEAVAQESQTIKHMIEDDCADNVIPVPNVTGPILSKVIEYCKRHVSDELGSSDDLKNFDDDFVKLDRPTLFNLIMAASYLDIKGLLDITCQAVANMLNNKSVEEIRAIFNITDDSTPAEEEQVRKDNEWAFQ